MLQYLVSAGNVSKSSWQKQAATFPSSYNERAQLIGDLTSRNGSSRRRVWKFGKRIKYEERKNMQGDKFDKNLEKNNLLDK